MMQMTAGTQIEICACVVYSISWIHSYGDRVHDPMTSNYFVIIVKLLFEWKIETSFVLTWRKTESVKRPLHTQEHSFP